MSDRYDKYTDGVGADDVRVIDSMVASKGRRPPTSGRAHLSSERHNPIVPVSSGMLGKVGRAKADFKAVRASVTSEGAKDGKLECGRVATPETRVSPAMKEPASGPEGPNIALPPSSSSPIKVAQRRVKRPRVMSSLPPSPPLVTPSSLPPSSFEPFNLDAWSPPPLSQVLDELSSERDKALSSLPPSSPPARSASVASGGRGASSPPNVVRGREHQTRRGHNSLLVDVEATVSGSDGVEDHVLSECDSDARFVTDHAHTSPVSSVHEWAVHAQGLRANASRSGGPAFDRPPVEPATIKLASLSKRKRGLSSDEPRPSSQVSEYEMDGFVVPDISEEDSPPKKFKGKGKAKKAKKAKKMSV